MIINYGDEEQKFTESKLIAYIGNKRRLINLIIKALEKCNIDRENDKTPPTFYEPFAGTGVISRLAKTQGFKVIANDWEYYSYIINKVYIEMDYELINKVFSRVGGIKLLLEKLNNLPPLNYENSYITKYYCPQDTNNPDLDNERLFYTRENGEKIDAIRERIDYLCDKYYKRTKYYSKIFKYTILSLLLYEASTRSNTSGVFKGFHRGFGGSNGDALSRIFKKLKIEEPILWENKYKHKVYKADAVKLTKKLSSVLKFDITYIDPPYNQHQYGSNYHLLNTIAYNDKPIINEDFYLDGKKINKSGIRKDWVKTKSIFCYKNTATEEFKNLIKNLNSKYILISYSTDGIINFDDMINILIEKGSIDIVTSQYVKYPGGKQSLKRLNNNVEFVLIVNTDKRGRKENKDKIYNKLINEKIPILFKKTISIKLLEEKGFKKGFSRIKNNNIIESYRKKYENHYIEIDIINGFNFFQNGNNNRYICPSDEKVELNLLPLNIKKNFLYDIEYSTNITKEDELNLILHILEKNINMENLDILYQYISKIPHLLNKFNNNKAYKTSLNMIVKIIKTFNSIPIHNLETKKVITSVKRLHNIIITKLEHKNNTDNVENLKKSIKKEYYENIVKKYELTV